MLIEQNKEILINFFKTIVPAVIEKYYNDVYNKDIKINFEHVKFDESGYLDKSIGYYLVNNIEFKVHIETDTYSPNKIRYIYIYPDVNSHGYTYKLDIHINDLLNATFLDNSFGQYFNGYILQTEVSDIKLKHFSVSDVYRLYKNPSTASSKSLGIRIKDDNIDLCWANGRFDITYFENKNDIIDIVQKWKDIQLKNCRENYYEDDQRREYRISKARVHDKEFAQLTLYGYKVYAGITIISDMIARNPDLVKKYNIVVEK